ncbi:anaphase-promoting complex subunit [Phlyctema vagabunda]|uniref:Anaphase-promoting complex subunit 2 n=1 Tax=Phlyctema vagabunda TaxID=108571 RepID=A0ABR4PPG9_9HELO
MASLKVAQSRQRRVFHAVFPTETKIGTPINTPEHGSTAAGRRSTNLASARRQATKEDSRGTRQPTLSLDEPDLVQDQVRWDRSWHAVTYFLALPDDLLHKDNHQMPSFRGKSSNSALRRALQDVLAPSSRLPSARETEDIIVWYTQHVRHHFLHHVLPFIPTSESMQDPEDALFQVITTLQSINHQYQQGLLFIAQEIEMLAPASSEPLVCKFHQDLHTLISSSVTGRVMHILRPVLTYYTYNILNIPKQTRLAGPPLLSGGLDTGNARRTMLHVVESLRGVGLAGESFQVIFAEVMNKAMGGYVKGVFEGSWSPSPAAEYQATEDKTRKTDEAGLVSTLHQTQSHSVLKLNDWIESQYSSLTAEVFNKIENVTVSWPDVEKWKEMSTGRLAGLRTSELFDIVVNWPRSNGALDDLRTAVTTPQRRLQLTDVFAVTLSGRLLHPGASTLEILQTYIAMIWSFHSLDTSKVLLDRVAYPLQLYLCSREDTVRIIVTGLLSDTEDDEGVPVQPGGDKLVELAILLNQDTDQTGHRVSEEELDWHDMEWVPDPVDAGPGYKRSKSADIIGTLIGVLGSQEVFIKEFQNVIGENLLRHEAGFEKENRVLELLKGRFGESPLQSCEVMIRDIQDSSRVDSVIRKTQQLETSPQEIQEALSISARSTQESYNSPEGLLAPSLHAKILSRLFWPQLQDESHRVPDEIEWLQKRYENGFETLKTSRKLTWLQTLGQVVVELELLDRTIREEVHTWQATVIWAFHSEESSDMPLTRSIDELVQYLEMGVPLVRSAVNFWVGKLVLQEASKDCFSVLETLNHEERTRSDAQAAAAAAASADNPTQDAGAMADDLTEKMQVPWQFIQGMLTNMASQMPLQQIAMMLKMSIADGFPYSNEELQEFLGTKISTGELELSGGKYKLRK